MTRRGVVVYANPALSQLLRTPDANGLRGRPLRDLVHPDDHGALQLPTSAAPRAGATPASEVRLLRSDGDTCAVEVAATTPPGSADGEGLYRLIGLFYAIEDGRAQRRGLAVDLLER